MRSPRLARPARKDDRRALCRRIERGLERRADGDDDTRAGLGLPQTNVGPVISRPREAQEIALPLAGPQRKQQRQMEMRWRALEKYRLVIGRPNPVGARAAIEPTAARAWVRQHKPAIMTPRQHAGEHLPRVVGLPP